KDVDKGEIINILDKIYYTIKAYKNEEVIAVEGDDCNSLGIILKGRIEIQKLFPSGQITTINNFKEGNIFGESLIFADRHTYPATITAIKPSEIMFINKNDITKLLMHNSNNHKNHTSVHSI